MRGKKKKLKMGQKMSQMKSQKILFSRSLDTMKISQNSSDDITFQEETKRITKRMTKSKYKIQSSEVLIYHSSFSIVPLYTD